MTIDEYLEQFRCDDGCYELLNWEDSTRDLERAKIEELIFLDVEHKDIKLVTKQIFANDPDWEHNSIAILELGGRFFKVKFNQDSWTDLGIPSVDWNHIVEVFPFEKTVTVYMEKGVSYE